MGNRIKGDAIRTLLSRVYSGHIVDSEAASTGGA